MAKFRSQQPIYDKIYEREKKQKEIDEEIRCIRHQNEQMIEKELQKRRDIQEKERQANEQEEKRFKKIEDMMSHPEMFVNSHSGSGMNHGMGATDLQTLIDDGLESRRSSRSDNPKPKTHHKSHLNEETLTNQLHHYHETTKGDLKKMHQSYLAKKTLTEFKATEIKGLQVDHPEVLAKFRAERASKYISKHPDTALHIPEPKELPNEPFKAGSTTSIHKFSLKDLPGKSSTRSLTNTNSSNNLTNSSSTKSFLPMKEMKDILKQTEEEIERQKLNISLHAKPTKSYSLPVQHKIK